MVSAKKKMIDKIPALISVPCMLHLLNLVTKDILGDESIKEIVALASRISAHFRRAHVWGDHLRKWAEETKKPATFKSHCETR